MKPEGGKCCAVEGVFLMKSSSINSTRDSLVEAPIGESSDFGDLLKSLKKAWGCGFKPIMLSAKWDLGGSKRGSGRSYGWEKELK